MKRWATDVQDPRGRRRLLAGAGGALLAAAVGGCVSVLQPQRRSLPAAALQLTPLRASIDRITQITVCTRPFRARGPRLEVERIGQKVVVHNYGHGGSGWSLSWGSSGVAVDQAMTTGERDIGVIGCGAMGLTSGLLAAASRRPGHHLCQGSAAQCPFIAGDRRMDPGLANLSRRVCDPCLQARLGRDGPPVIQDLSNPARPAR